MFSIEDVKKIAKLSALQVNEAEAEVFAQQFSNILDYFQILESVEVSDETVDRDESMMVQFRGDELKPSSIVPEDFSPYTENHFFKVPKVIDAS